MRRSRFSDAEILAILAEQGEGATTADVCRRHGISQATFYNWKARLKPARGSADGFREASGQSDAWIGPRAREDGTDQVRALQQENDRLKLLLADAMLEIFALKNPNRT